VLFLVPALVTAPFTRIGSVDANGNERMRAYFTADFVWHMALVAELQKHAHPPRNPYLASEPIHYYWTYFIVPAVAGPVAGADVALSLKINALATAVLFVSMIHVFAWTCLPRSPLTVAAAVTLIVLAASLEGVAAIVYVLSRGQPLTALRDLNVDALSRGFGGLRIDDLPRAMWYTPQHAMAYAAGLMALLVALRHTARADLAAILIAGTALGAAVVLNPFVGALFCVLYAAGVMIDAGGSASAVARVCVRHALAVVPVGAALAWIFGNRIAEGASGTLHFGVFGPAANAPIASLLLSLGPVLVFIVAGVWRYRAVPWKPVALAATGVALSLVVMHVVTMTVDPFWVGFRTGHLLLVFAPVLAARALIGLSVSSRARAIAFGALILLVGGPTTAIDAFNAQDVENDHQGPGFHWTVKITPAEQEALAWIRTRTAPDAVVQAEPVIRGRETWSLIPSFAERRMAGGLPISLMHVPEYDVISAQVREIYATADVARAWRLARALGIDYLYVDATERRAYPDTMKWESSPELFSGVFRNSEVTVVAVLGSQPDSGTGRVHHAVRGVGQ
jgi:hypothetical protein